LTESELKKTDCRTKLILEEEFRL